MGKWILDLKENGTQLREAVRKEDYQGIINSMKQCNKSILKFLKTTDLIAVDDKKYIAHQIDRINSDLEMHQSKLNDEELLGSDLDCTLGEFYDICDSARIWVTL